MNDRAEPTEAVPRISIHRRRAPRSHLRRGKRCRRHHRGDCLFPHRLLHEDSARTMSRRLRTNRNAPMSKANSHARLFRGFSGLPASEVAQAGNHRPRHRQSPGAFGGAARRPHRIPIASTCRPQCRTELAGIAAMARPPGRIPRPRCGGRDPTPMPVKQVHAEKADQSQTQDDFGGGHDLISGPSPDANAAKRAAKVV